MELNGYLPRVVDSIVDSIAEHPTTRHLNKVNLPNRDAIIQAVGLMQQIVFPGYFGKQGLTSDSVRYRVGELVTELANILFGQVRCCLRYGEQEIEHKTTDKCDESDREAALKVEAFLSRIPDVRRMLVGDVQAAFDGDPAAFSTDEALFSYPGIFAIMVQRLAHEFYKADVALLPRIMTEHAHSLTGIDIHPGAELGERLFIDHGTGVVIGETTQIGNSVKIYQGVTLGALAPAYGQALRGQKRHPTIEDNVTIYAGATILGGETIIGSGSTIGGNVFITASVPPHNQVVAEPPKLKYRDRRNKRNDAIDFQI